MKNQYIGGYCIKRGAWTVCRFKRGEGGGLRGVDTPMYTMEVEVGTLLLSNDENMLLLKMY